MIRKIAIVSKREVSDDLIKILEDLGFEYTKSNPDAVISLGGDGTYLYSERKFPGIPKLLIRDSAVCKKCGTDMIEKVILERLKTGDYTIEENLKLDAIVKGRKFTCTNDFIIRNKLQTRAIRFRVRINEKDVNRVLIGDGVVISTPFGSTGYFHSITGRSFKRGIGIAFNNLTKKVRHRIIDEDSRILVKVVRDHALFSCDNHPELVELGENERVEIRKSREVARIIRFVQES